MSNALRLFSTQRRLLCQPSKFHHPSALPQRSFHSPFVVLNSPLTLSPSSAADTAPLYEKQHDHSPEPQLSSAGTRTYVVSEPDPANTPYAVPYGAYPASAPYANLQPTEAPRPERRYASTRASLPIHYTTRAVLRSATSVGESAAVRHTEAPGEVSRRGSYGGVGWMDKSTELPHRNPSPDSGVAPN